MAGLADAKPKKPRATAPVRDDTVPYGPRDDVMRFGAELAERQGLPAEWVQSQLAEARFGPRGAPLATLLRTLDAQRYGRGAIARPSTPWLRAVQAQVRTLERALANAPT